MVHKKQDTVNSFLNIFCVHNVTRPFLHSLRYAKTIAQITKQKKYYNQLDYIERYTSKDIQIPYAILEYWVLKDQTISSRKRYNYNDNEINLPQAVYYLNKAYIEITEIVGKIAVETGASLSFDMGVY